MTHPLKAVMDAADGFLLLGDSAADRFPATSYGAFTQAGKRFYCLDLGGLTESRGRVQGGKVYLSVEELPKDGRDDLALIWVHPHRAADAVKVAYRAGCRRVWFSFKTGHPEAVDAARELGMEVVEIGRCPVYYLDNPGAMCAFHTAVTKASGTWKRPPQTQNGVPRRELV